MSFGGPLLGRVGARHRERGWETVVCLGGKLRFALQRGELGGGAGNGCRPAPPRAPTVYFRTAQPLALRRMRGSALWGERRSREGRPARRGEVRERAGGWGLREAITGVREARGPHRPGLSARARTNLGRSRSPNRTRGVSAGRAASFRRRGIAERSGLGCAGRFSRAAPPCARSESPTGRRRRSARRPSAPPPYSPVTSVVFDVFLYVESALV